MRRWRCVRSKGCGSVLNSVLDYCFRQVLKKEYVSSCQTVSSNMYKLWEFGASKLFTFFSQIVVICNTQSGKATEF
jgi:hypothetical protein